MTPEERLAVLEARVGGWEAQAARMDEKLDQLLEAAAMGRGAWWAIIKIGGVLVTLATMVAWFGDRLHFFNWNSL